MRVAIIGSRTFTSSPEEIEKQIIKEIPPGCSEIVSGGAVGVDKLAERAAKKLNLPIKRFLPDYALHGKTATLKRNIEIINYADLILAFWNAESNGTRFVMAECIKRGKPVKVILIK